MAKSAERIKTKNLKVHTQKVVSEAKQSCSSESEFRAKLKDESIDVLFRRNDEGRIYGATFIDHTTRTVLNGSRLGKDYSANVFNELYGGKQENVQEPMQTTNLSDAYKNSEKSSKQLDNSQSPDGGLGGIFSVLSHEPENHPKDEKPFVRRKKKNKRRYGRQM